MAKTITPPPSSQRPPQPDLSDPEFRVFADTEIDRQDRRHRITVVLIVAAVFVLLAFFAGLYSGMTQPRQFTARYIMGGGGLVRAHIIDAGDTGLGDLLDIAPTAEYILEMDDARAALLLPGDVFTAHCQIDTGGRLRFSRCEINPMVTRGQ